ncbi:MAG TPA: hypothetical protein VH206_19910 [Xanthobacteraceae bacterium]|jgi:hypothetical protein|nr:hypothetical protein [Xanthobacteraceae bacterium]
MQDKAFSWPNGRTRFSLLANVSLIALAAVLLLSAGCSKSDQQQQADSQKPASQQPANTSPFHTQHLPRIAGAKEIYASDATTYFSAPNTVAQTADLVEKALGADGWQRYGAPHATEMVSDTTTVMSFKKGPIGLGVLITVAPPPNNQNNTTQNNPAQTSTNQAGATQSSVSNVQYNETTLANDLPMPKDATEIAFDPNRPFLTLVSTESPNEALDFYRKELTPLGWSLWSQKANGIAPAGGPSGAITSKGAYAYYMQGDDHFAILTLENADAGHVKIKFETLPMSYLQSLQKSYYDTDNVEATLVDVTALPRLDGAAIDPSHTSSNRMTYSAAGSVADTVAATEKLLAAAGWQRYVKPLEKEEGTSLAFKKGVQGLLVSFTMNGGRADQSSVDYVPNRLRFALALTADASAVVFDDNRPYLGFVTAGTVDTTLDTLRAALGTQGWSPMSAADAVKQWPDAKLEEISPAGAFAYFTRGTRHPIVMSVQRRSDGATAVEIKTPAFAEPKTLEADDGYFGLPVPKPHPTAGGTGGDRERSIHALVPAEVATVLDFYRRELTALHWTEESQGEVLALDKAVVNFTSPDGPATLKLDHRYDLTNVSLVLHVNKPAPQPQAKATDPVQVAADALKEAQDMMRKAGITPSSDRAPPPVAATPEQPPHLLADSTVPVAMPDNAEKIDFDAPGGNLEFDSVSSVQSLADFYRATMKQQGWSSKPSVINKPNMVVLDFAKGRDSLEVTLLRMGDRTNVTVEGAVLKITAKLEADTSPKQGTSKQTAPKQTTPVTIEGEESHGLPMPKDHELSEATSTPFRREVKAGGVPFEIADLLGFYRSELGKLGWKEEGQGTSNRASASADHAAIAFTTPDGPAKLTLDRNGDKTDVGLVVKNPDAAAKAGMMPKQGQAKILFGNINPAAETITFANQAIKVGAGAGTKGPDGPSIDVPPGKYAYSIKHAGAPTQNDEIVIGANETWGLMIGPGGVLPLQAY